MKTQYQLITGKKSKWVIVDEKGNILAEFRIKTTAQQNLPRYKLSRYEKLEVREKI